MGIGWAFGMTLADHGFWSMIKDKGGWVDLTKMRDEGHVYKRVKVIIAGI